MIDLGPLLVILLYGLALAVILFVSPRLGAVGVRVRFWASVVALAQIVIYALWG
jgi:hypothetical protein